MYPVLSVVIPASVAELYRSTVGPSPSGTTGGDTTGAT
jgi:hypothetical protein